MTCVSTRPFRRCAKPGRARRKRDVAGARIKSAEAARHNASAAKQVAGKAWLREVGSRDGEQTLRAAIRDGIRGRLHIAANQANGERSIQLLGQLDSGAK